MNIAIVGSQSFADEPVNESVRTRVKVFVEKLCYDGDHTIISGGAAGPDTWAEEAAEYFGLDTDIHKPDWNEHGKAAGFIRNETMVKKADAVVAFWDGESNGTKHTILKARENKIPCNIYVRYNDE